MSLQKQYFAAPVQNLTDWTIETVRVALARLESGDFGLAAALADAMMRDDQIGANLDIRVKGVLGLPVEFEASEENPNGAATVAERLKRVSSTIATKDTREEILRWKIMLGIVPVQIVWKKDAKEWTPVLDVWHPSNLYRDEYKREWSIQTLDAGRQIVGVEPYKWALFAHGDTRPYMTGLVRRLAIPWLIRQFAWRDWARYSEVHGLPIRKAKVPSDAMEAEKKRFLNQLLDLASESVILTPTALDASGNEHGFDMELVEAVANNHESFDKLLARCDKAIAISILGQNLTTEVSGGSLAAARVHDRVRGDLIEADAQGHAEDMRREVYKPWAMFNFGDAALAPTEHFQTDPPDDKKAKADTLSSLGDAITKLKKVGVQLDLERLAEDYGLPVTSTEFAEPEPDPAQQNGQEAQGNPSGVQQTRRSERPVFLASQDAPESAPDFVAGQLYVDGVVENSLNPARQAVEQDIQVLLSVIDGCTDYEEVRNAVTAHFTEYKGVKLRGLIQAALTLSKLAGLYGASREANL